MTDLQARMGELVSLEKRATPAPWTGSVDEIWTSDCKAALFRVVSPPSHDFEEHMANADLVVELRNAAPELLQSAARIAALAAALQEAEAKLAMVSAAGKAYIAEDCTGYVSVGERGLRDAITAADPTVAAFLTRVKRQGAAEELRDMGGVLRDEAEGWSRDSASFELRELIAARLILRAAELEGE